MMRRVLASLCLVLGAVPTQAQPVPLPLCTVVFGQGRNHAESDAQANLAWNTVNRIFNTQVVAELNNASLRAIQLFMPVEATDLQANVAGLLARVERENCDRVIETAVFANPEAELLVVRLRAYPIVRIANTNATSFDGKVPSIGKASYTNQRDFQLNQRSLDRLAPTALAKDMSSDFVKAQTPPPAQPAN